MKKQGIKNIVWDWNGTIVNDAWLFVDIMNKVLKKNNLPSINLKKYKKNFCFPIEDYWSGLGFNFTKQEFQKLNNFFISEYQKKMFVPLVHDNIVPLFDLLKKAGVQQFVLSASEQKLLNQSVKHYKLNSFFSGVYGVDNLSARGKEHVGKTLLKKHSLGCEETLFIGDTEHDCSVAENLGCDVLLISHGHIDHAKLLQTKKTVLKTVSNLKSFLIQSII